MSLYICTGLIQVYNFPGVLPEEKRDKYKHADKQGTHAKGNDEENEGDLVPKVNGKQIEALGTDPTVSGTSQVNLHCDIVSRWEFWIISDLKKTETAWKIAKKRKYSFESPRSQSSYVDVNELKGH